MTFTVRSHRASRWMAALGPVAVIALGLFIVLGSFRSEPVFAQTPLEEMKEMKEQLQKQQAERDEMKRRLEQLEVTTGAPTALAPAVRFNVGRNQPRPTENYINCPGFLDCLAEPQLQLEFPKPTSQPGWEFDLWGYSRFKFNYYNNFSDTVLASAAAGATCGVSAGASAGCAIQNATGNAQTLDSATGSSGSQASFNKAKKQDDGIRFSTMLGYIAGAVKKGPFTIVANIGFAGDTFNDGVALGNDQGPLGPAGQRFFVMTPQQYYIQYNEKLFGRDFQIRLGRHMGHLGNGIVGHLPRDLVTAAYKVTPEVEFTQGYVWGATGNAIPNQGNLTFAPYRGLVGTPAVIGTQTNQTAQTFVNAPDGSQQYLEGILEQITWRPNPDNKLQVFFFRMWDTTQEAINKNNYWVDVNGAGLLRFGRNRLDYMFEAVRVQGETQGTGVGAANGVSPRQDDRRSWLLMTDLRWTPFGSEARPDLYSLGITAGAASGDNNPNDGVNKNFDALFQDETAFHYNFLYSDDIHGYNGRAFDTTRGSGFTNTFVLQPYVILRPTEKLRTKISYSHLMAVSAVAPGVGPFGGFTGATAPGTPQPMAFSSVPLSGPATRDIGKEIDVLTDYFIDKNSRFFAYYGTFLPGRVYAPIADIAYKLEVGYEFRF